LRYLKRLNQNFSLFRHFSLNRTISVIKQGSISIISICRPKFRNAVDSSTANQLRTAFEEFDNDKDQKVAILSGEGNTFCAGYDLKQVVLSGPSMPLEAINNPLGPGPMGPTRMLLNKPVIAAIEGHAVAGGLELALWCDIRIASTSSIFGVFCRRWGVPLIDGGTVRLPRLIGQGRAMVFIHINSFTIYSY
jgi:enoyl-CoA hydratase